jgi:hypothetical protein
MRARYLLFSTVRFTDCISLTLIPAVNCWAIVSRPLRGLVELFVQTRGQCIAILGRSPSQVVLHKKSFNKFTTAHTSDSVTSLSPLPMGEGEGEGLDAP